MGYVAARGAVLVEDTFNSQEFIENAVLGLFRAAAGGPGLWGNPAFAELLGYDDNNDLSAGALDFPGQVFSDPEAAQSLRDKIEEDGVVRGFEAQLVTKAGTVVWASLHVRRGQDKTGALFYEGIAEDISQRKMFEDVGDEVNDKFRSIFDNAVEGIYQAAPGGEFIGVNPALARMLGYEHPDDLAYGTFIHEFFLDRGMAEHFWNMLVEDGEVRDFEALSRRHDGSEIWLRHNARSIRTPWDEVQYCEGTIEDITDRKSMEAELMRLATTDPLTGTMNRREFMEAAERELHRARRHDRALSVLMLDADHFKSINDTYGHNAGDETLRQLAASARQSLRDIDVIGRLGGEEFAILLPEEGLEGGRVAAERLRAGMSQLQLMVGSEIVRFTVSIGVAELSPQDKGIDDLLRRSDQALYRAKNNGRNRVEVGI